MRQSGTDFRVANDFGHRVAGVGLAAGFYATAAVVIFCAALATLFALRNPSIKQVFATE